MSRRQFLEDVPIKTRHAIRKLYEGDKGHAPVSVMHLALRFGVSQGIVRKAIKWSKDATTESKIEW